MDPLSWNG